MRGVLPMLWSTLILWAVYTSTCSGKMIRIVDNSSPNYQNYARLGRNLQLLPEFTDFTICVFVRVESGYAGGTVLSISKLGNDNVFFLQTFMDGLTRVYSGVYLSYSAGNQYYVNWHEVCVTRSGSEGTIYVDGEQKTSGNMGSAAITRESIMVIGQECDNFGGGFGASDSFKGGFAAEVNVWDWVVGVTTKPCGEAGNILSMDPVASIFLIHYGVEQTTENLTCADGTTLADRLVLDFSSHDTDVTYVTHADLGLQTPVSQYTICFWYRNAAVRHQYLLSVNTVSAAGPYDNAPAILMTDNTIVVYNQGWGYTVLRPAAYVANQWMQLCETMDGAGRYGLYHDKEEIYNTVHFSPGTTMLENAQIALGIESDCYAGCFDSGQVFYGKISALNVWDQFLNTEQISLIECADVGNLVSWNDIVINTFGTTTVEESSEFCAESHATIDPYGGTLATKRGQNFCPLRDWSYSSSSMSTIFLDRIHESDLLKCTHACVSNADCQSFVRNPSSCLLMSASPMTRPQLMERAQGNVIYSYDVC